MSRGHTHHSVTFVLPAETPKVRQRLVIAIEEVMSKRLERAAEAEAATIVAEFDLLVENAEKGNPAVLLALCEMHGIPCTFQGVA